MKLSWIKLFYSKIHLIATFFSLVRVQFIPCVVSFTSAKFPLLQAERVEESEQSTAASSGKGDIHPVLMGAWESFPGGEAANADTHSLHLPIFFLFQLNRSCHSPAFP